MSGRFTGPPENEVGPERIICYTNDHDDIEEFADMMYGKFYYSLYNHRNKWYNFLHQFLSHKNKFNRESAWPFRKLCKDIFQLHKQLLFFGMEKRGDCFVSLLEYRDLVVGNGGAGKRAKPVYLSHHPFPEVFLDIDIDKWYLSPDEVAVDHEFFEWRKSLVADKRFTSAEVNKMPIRVLVDGWEEETDLGPPVFPLPPREPLEKLGRALLEAEEVRDHFDGLPDIWFSAGKGFHVNVWSKQDMDPTVERGVAKAMRDELGLRMCDPTVWGDIARVRRIPYTIHPRTFRFVVPVLKNEILCDVIRRSEEDVIPEKFKPRKVDLSSIIEFVLGKEGSAIQNPPSLLP